MPDLLAPPKYLRSTPVRQSDSLPIDRKGGSYGAGVIRGLSLITSGEALGHDMWIDDVFLSQVAEFSNRPNKGLKSRFTHPGLSGDGLGRHVGRAHNASVDGDRVRADLHFSNSAHETPDGDLASYLMTLAGEDSEALGMSIVFVHDFDAMEAFMELHTADGIYTSPVTENFKNLPHARLAELRAVDFVDEPAANPDGLFSRSQDIPDAAFAVADYALGRTTDAPSGALIGVDADRLRHFVSRYLSHHKLQVTTMAQELDATAVVDEPIVSDVLPDEETKIAEDENDTATEDAPPVAEVTDEQRSEAARYRAAFGDQGAVWFAEGLSFEDCRSKELETMRDQIRQLRANNEKLLQRLSAVDGDGEADPVKFDAADSPKRRSFIRFRDQLN